MEDINEILNNESNNDKQLLKDLSCYLKHHRDNKKEINSKFVKDIIYIILDNEVPLLNNIYIKDLSNINAVGSAYDDYLCVDMNVSEKIINKNKKSNFYLSNDNRLIHYMHYLNLAFHELAHFKQDYVTKENYTDIYKSSNELVNYYYSIYRENWDIMPIERHAELRGYEMAYNTLSYIYDLKYLTYLKLEIINSLINAYDVDTLKSPIELFNELINEYNITPITTSMSKYESLYSRLYLGLPISADEYNFVIDLYNDILNNKYKNDNVKELIKL